jgi:DNA-binding transcriptional regulator YiaG
MTKPNTSIDLLRMIDPSGGLLSCWSYIGKRWHKAGYGYPKKNQKPILAHRWSYEHHYNVSLTPDIVIRHTCDNPACCNPLHLLSGTQVDNVQDAVKRKRMRYSAVTPFTKKQLIEMKKLRQQGLTQQKISDIYGCSQVTISHWEKKNWQMNPTTKTKVKTF